MTVECSAGLKGTACVR